MKSSYRSLIAVAGYDLGRALLKDGGFCVVAAVVTVAAHAQSTTTITREYDQTTGLLKSETRDGDVKQSFTYDTAGNLETVTDPRGFVTRYSSYKLGIPQLEVHAEGTTEQVSISREVNSSGCVTAKTDGEGNRTVFGRDGLCRVTTITPAKVGSVGTTIVYSPYTTTEPETHTITRTYSAPHSHARWSLAVVAAGLSSGACDT